MVSYRTIVLYCIVLYCIDSIVLYHIILYYTVLNCITFQEQQMLRLGESEGCRLSEGIRSGSAWVTWAAQPWQDVGYSRGASWPSPQCLGTMRCSSVPTLPLHQHKGVVLGTEMWNWKYLISTTLGILALGQNMHLEEKIRYFKKLVFLILSNGYVEKVRYYLRVTDTSYLLPSFWLGPAKGRAVLVASRAGSVLSSLWRHFRFCHFVF